MSVRRAPGERRHRERRRDPCEDPEYDEGLPPAPDHRVGPESHCRPSAFAHVASTTADVADGRGGQLDRASSRRCPAASSASLSRSRWSCGAAATLHSVTARSVEVRDPTFEHGSFAEHRAGSDLGERLTVDLDDQHPVEQQEQLVAARALLHQRLAFLHPADVGLLSAAHDPLLQLALEQRLDLR